MQKQILQPVEEVWQHHCTALGEALTQTILELNNLARLDDYHRHGHDAEKLEQALGPFASNSLDFSALSTVLSNKSGSRAMAPVRVDRIQRLLKTLEAIKSDGCNFAEGCSSIEIGEEEARIHEAAEAHLNRMAMVFRTLRMAQLEIRSKYDPDVHDAIFENFDWRELSPGELRLCPPFLVIALLNENQGPQLRKAMGILESRKPIKVAALRADLKTRYTSINDLSLPASMAVEMVPVAMRGVYFLQSCVADPHFETSLFDALTSPRPGIISLLCPFEDEDPSAFHRRADRAVQARAFPLCSYDPDRSRNFVNCFDLGGNPALENAWTSSEANDSTGSINPDEDAFTFAHYAAGEASFADDFSLLQGEDSAANLTPLPAYLELNRRQRVGKTPFILIRGNGGVSIRKTVSSAIVIQTADRLHLWRTLQEIAGIDNPHIHTTRKALTAEFGTAQEVLTETLQAKMEAEAVHREQVAVAHAVRKIVSDLTGVDASHIDLSGMIPDKSES